jgi:hypothetical protein
VRFGPSEASAIKVHRRDIDGDGYLDAVFQFRIYATRIPCGGSSATLIGSTSNGRRFQGTDAIATLGCRGR